MSRIKLKHLLNILITSMLILIMLIGSHFMLSQARENVQVELESTSNLALHFLDSQVAVFAESETEEITHIRFHLSRLSEIRHLRIEYFDETDRLVESNQFNLPVTETSLVPQWFSDLLVSDAPEKKISRDVIIKNNNLGRLVITPDPSFEIEEIWSDTKDLFALVLLYFVLVNTVVYGAIDWAFKPINKILSALTDLENGKLSTRLPVFKLPEFLIISEKFNHMVQILEQSVNRNKGLSRQIISLEENERKSLARDLHDEIGQSITAIHVDAQAILNTKEADLAASQNVIKSANAISEVAKKMMGITHQIMDKLRPGLVDKMGLQLALEDLVSNWQAKLNDTHCQLDVSGEVNDLPEDIAITAYRIVQENLTNAAKYSKASLVSIGVLRDGDALVLMIEDDGKGFDTEQITNGYGLMGMRERVDGLGGEFELDSTPGIGTRMLVRLPFSIQEEIEKI